MLVVECITFLMLVYFAYEGGRIIHGAIRRPASPMGDRLIEAAFGALFVFIAAIIALALITFLAVI